MQIAVARIVENRPEFNTHDDVGRLLDLMMFHGIDRARALSKLIEDGLSLETIHLTANFLYEEGERGGTVTGKDWFAKKGHSGISFLKEVAALITSLSSDLERTFTDTDEVASLIEQLGGLEQALEANDIRLKEAAEFIEYGMPNLEQLQQEQMDNLDDDSIVDNEDDELGVGSRKNPKRATRGTAQTQQEVTEELEVYLVTRESD